METKKGLSWGWITLIVIVFWPIGIYLLIKKFNNDKTALFNHSNGLKITSYILMIFGLLALGLTLSGNMTRTDTSGVQQVVTGSTMISYLLVSLMFILGGIVLFNKMKKIEKESARYKRYINLIINNNLTDLSEIASAISTSTTQVMEEIQKMIDVQYLPNAYIDRSRNKIVLTKKNTDVSNQQETLEIFVCPSCGARNELYASDQKICEYCGNHLK